MTYKHTNTQRKNTYFKLKQILVKSVIKKANYNVFPNMLAYLNGPKMFKLKRGLKAALHIKSSRLRASKLTASQSWSLKLFE